MEHLVRGLKTDNTELQKHCASAIFKVVLFTPILSASVGVKGTNVVYLLNDLYIFNSVQRRRQPVHL